MTKSQDRSPWHLSPLEARLRELRVAVQMISAMARCCRPGTPDGAAMLLLQREGFSAGEIDRLWPLVCATVEALAVTQPSPSREARA